MEKFYNFIKNSFYGIFAYLLFCGLGYFYKTKHHKNPKGNIVLISGFMHNSFTMRPTGVWLNKLGYNVYFPQIGWNVCELDQQTKKVDFFWQNLKIKKNVPLYIIGHSMGGLIAHYWIKNFQIQPNKLITLGTPFLGSSAIYWGPWYFLPAAKWLKPKKKLPNYILKKSNFKQVNLVTKEDIFVTIKSGLPEAIESQKIVLKNVGGHSGLEINAKQVGKKILETCL